MRIEEIELAIRADQFEVLESVFKTPPQNFESFQNRLGLYQGLARALEVIKKEKAKSEDY